MSRLILLLIIFPCFFIFSSCNDKDNVKAKTDSSTPPPIEKKKEKEEEKKEEEPKVLQKDPTPPTITLEKPQAQALPQVQEDSQEKILDDKLKDNFKYSPYDVMLLIKDFSYSEKLVLYEKRNSSAISRDFQFLPQVLQLFKAWGVDALTYYYSDSVWTKEVFDSTLQGLPELSQYLTFKEYAEVMAVEVIKPSSLIEFTNLWGNKFSLKEKYSLIKNDLALFYRLSELKRYWKEEISYEDILNFRKEGLKLKYLALLKKVWGKEIKLSDIKKITDSGLTIYQAYILKEKINISFDQLFELNQKYSKKELYEIMVFLKLLPDQIALEDFYKLVPKITFINDDGLSTLKNQLNTQDFLCFVVDGIYEPEGNKIPFFKVIKSFVPFNPLYQTYQVASNGKKCIVVPEYKKVDQFIDLAEKNSLLKKGDKIFFLQEAHGGKGGVSHLDNEELSAEGLVTIYKKYLKKYRLGIYSKSCYGGNVLELSLKKISQKYHSNFCMFTASIPNTTASSFRHIQDEAIGLFFMKLKSGENMQSLLPATHLASLFPQRYLDASILNPELMTEARTKFLSEVRGQYSHKSCTSCEDNQSETGRKDNSHLFYQELLSLLNNHKEKYLEILDEQDLLRYKACENFDFNFNLM